MLLRRRIQVSGDQPRVAIRADPPRMLDAHGMMLSAGAAVIAQRRNSWWVGSWGVHKQGLKQERRDVNIIVR